MPRNYCEASNTDCYPFIPRVSFSWSDKSQAQPTLDGFTAYYMLDYGQVGLARVKDQDDFRKAGAQNLGQQEILTKEVKFTAVEEGRIRDYDNIHTAYDGKSVWLPGCTRISFECVHAHWRWSKIQREASNAWGFLAGFGGLYYSKSEVGGNLRMPNVDPMFDPSSGAAIDEHLRGTPYLVDRQTIEIVITRQENNEGKPRHPDLVLDLARDGQVISTPPTKTKLVAGVETEVEDPYTVGSPNDVVVWYVASVKNKATDTFFKHGIFVLDFQKADTSRAALQKLHTDLAASSELDADTKSQLLAHLNESIQDRYWITDNNNLLVQENIERVFSELAQTVSLMQQVKNQRPSVAQSMDLYTFTVLSAIHNSVDNALSNEVANIKTSIQVSESELGNLFAENEAISLALEQYDAALNESELINAAQIVDNFRNSLKNGSQGIREVSNTLNQSQQPTSATSTTTTTNTTTTTSASTASSNITDSNGTTTTTTTITPPPATVTTTTPPSITSVDLHPDSVPQFFKCGETPDTGLPTLPGLDVQSSAYTTITDGDANTEILGKAIFDVTFSERIKNGPGPDLIVYEIGNGPEPFNVTLFSGDVLTQSIEYNAFATGNADNCGYGVNAAEIDLSDFGFGEEGEQEGDGSEEIIAITGIRVDNLGAEGCCTGADISDVVIVSPIAAATTTTTEDMPLLAEQEQQQQQQDEDEPNTEGEGIQSPSDNAGNNIEPEQEAEDAEQGESDESNEEEESEE